MIKKIGSYSSGCYCCVRSNHIPANCKFKYAKCLKCKKTGHNMPACQMLKQKQPSTPQQKQKTHHLDADAQSPEDTDNSNSDQFKLHRLGKASSEPIMVSSGLMVRRLRWKLTWVPHFVSYQKLPDKQYSQTRNCNHLIW